MYKFDNYKVIKNKNKKLYDILMNLEKNTNNSSVKVCPSKSGTNTLSVIHDEKEYFYHSKYNPLKDAKAFSVPYLNLEQKSHILFIGVGLGYHVTEILNSNPSIKFSIYEPNQVVLKNFIEQFNLNKYGKRLVEIFSEENEIMNRQVFFKYYSSNTEDIILPVVKQLYSDKINAFQKNISITMKHIKESRQIDFALQRRWTVNPIINFPKIIQVPNLLLDVEKDKFKNKPAIIVSAGPSLAQDIDYIRKIKEEGRAYIFAAGSGVNALIANGVFPDAVFSIDPNAINANVFEAIKEKKHNIPLVFGSSIAFEVIEDYPGKLISFMLNQDKFSQYLLEYNDEIITYDAESVANMTLQPLMKLGANPIIFAGQNLAYLNNRIYSEGIKYKHISSEINEKQKNEQVEVLSVIGEQLYTSPYYLRMKLNLEYYIANNPSFNFINTTKNGAQIEGTKFIPIEQVYEDILTEKRIVEKDWHEVSASYDVEFARQKFAKLEDSFDDLINYTNKCLEYLAELLEMNEKNDYRNMEIYLTAYDKLFERIQENDFFEVIIQPITRVQHEIFIINSPDVAPEKNPRNKIKLFNKIFGAYLRAIYAAVLDIQPAFAVLKNSEFLKKEEEV